MCKVNQLPILADEDAMRVMNFKFIEDQSEQESWDIIDGLVLDLAGGAQVAIKNLSP